jgi:hypothetical protein
MTIVYRGDQWHLGEDEVHVRCDGEESRAVDPADVPLPVARALGLLRPAEAA